MSFVEISNLEVYYPNRYRPSLHIESLVISEGESVLLAGKSGSGKSTLINVLNGVVPNLITAEVEGDVRVFGRDPRRQPIYETAKLVGTLLQDPETQVFNYTVKDEVAFGPENLMLPREEIVRRVEAAASMTGITHLLERDVGTLSGGELQRTALASILAMQPRALILDEPTSNIDPKGTAEIFSLIRSFRKSGVSLIIAEHKLDRVLPYVDRVILIDSGRVVFDVRKEELIGKADLLHSAGVEIPEYYLYLKSVGASSLDSGSLRGYSYTPPPRREGGEEVLYAKATVRTKSGNTLVDAEVRLRKGEIVALMGNNGAGKSTLFKAIMGMLDRKLVSDVTLVVKGRDLSRKGLAERGSYIAYLPQNFDVMFVRRTVEGEVSFAMKNRRGYSEERLNEILKEFSLYRYRREDPLLLSMGQRRRVAMASIISSGADIVLMDEPTSGQDWYHRAMLGREVQAMRDKQYTFFIITHDSRFVDKFCDRVLVMGKGRIVAEGKPEEVFSRSDLDIYPPTEYVVAKSGVLEFPV